MNFFFYNMETSKNRPVRLSIPGIFNRYNRYPEARQFGLFRRGFLVTATVSVSTRF